MRKQKGIACGFTGDLTRDQRGAAKRGQAHCLILTDAAIHDSANFRCSRLIPTSKPSHTATNPRLIEAYCWIVNPSQVPINTIPACAMSPTRQKNVSIAALALYLA